MANVCVAQPSKRIEHRTAQPKATTTTILIISDFQLKRKLKKRKEKLVQCL